MIEIPKSEYESLVKDRTELKTLQKEYEDLKVKNGELSQNIVKVKESLKTKHKDELLELTTGKEELETKLNLFKEKLEISDEIELETFLEDIKIDLSSYKEIKSVQEQEKQENIKKYTDFLNSTNKKGEDFLKTQAEVFGEGVLQNLKALEGFAKARGFKEKGEKETPEKRIEVGELKTGEKPTGFDDFNENLANGNIEGMEKNALKDLLSN